MGRYKYNRTKDFRRERPKLIKVRNGWRWMQGCDEFIAGRWEGFVSFPGLVWKSKAEALKHKPKW